MGNSLGARAWNILVVDDEPDVHDITRLALKHKRWKKRPFSIHSALCGEEARAALAKHPPDYFQVAMIDVVMETDFAGFDLCKHIRGAHPSSLRIILRTGQPGVAPEEYVLNSLDVDHYLAKAEATPQKLYTLIRSCLRSSQDISTLVAFATQLQNFTRALKDLSSVADLLVFMQEGLAFLELKHAVTTAFFYDLDSPPGEAVLGGGVQELGVDLGRLHRTFLGLRDGKLPLDRVHSNEDFPELKLSENAFFVPFECVIDVGQQEGDAQTVVKKFGTLYVEMRPESVSEQNVSDFASDTALFLENWKIAYATLQLQERLARERMLREQMYYERLQSIATMVTGVAHELNTPLGVANTANGMISSLAERISSSEGSETERVEMVDDLRQSCRLLSKNLQRAQGLVSSFKQLSSSQMAGERLECALMGVIHDCVESMQPQMRKSGVTGEVQVQTDDLPAWDGYPGHLSQVIVNFIQNVLRYGRNEDGTGHFKVVLSGAVVGGAEGFRIEFSDSGKGVPPEILPRIFEPFVTSGRGKGGTGLGLAIVNNIVTELLGGTITVDSAPSRGTKFTIILPRSAPHKGDVPGGLSAGCSTVTPRMVEAV